MTRKTFIYSLKVWITSVLIAPILFGLLLCLNQTIQPGQLVDYGINLAAMYVGFALGQMLFSLPTGLLFWFFTWLIIQLPFRLKLRVMLVFFAGIGLTVGTSAIILSPFGLFNDSGLLYLMYANCAVIGWGVFYYKFEPNYKQLINFNKE